jgi:hypothetical protein
VLSSLSQLIVVPTAIVNGFWPNAVVVCVDAPVGIFTDVLPAGADVGPVEGAEGELYPPHAAKDMTSKSTEVTRINISAILLRALKGKDAAAQLDRFPSSFSRVQVSIFSD